MKNRTIFHLYTLAVVTTILTACGGTSSQQASSMSTQAPTVSSDAPKGYMDSEPSSVLFVQWTEKNGQMSGQLQDVYVSSNNSLQTQHDNEAFTGTHDGSNISISTSIFGFIKTYTGSFNGDTLTLVVPSQDGTLHTLTLHSASVDDYNKAATTLIQTMNQQAAQATATEQIQETDAQNAQATATVQSGLYQAVSAANDALRQDFTHLDNDRSTLQQEQDLSSSTKGYQNDIATMQKDVGTEQSDAKNGCGDSNNNYAQVGNDKAQVDNDNAQISNDDAGFKQAYQQVADAIDGTNQRIGATQDDWKKLQTALAAGAPGEAGAAYSQQDVNSEVQSTQGQITTTKNAIDVQANTVTDYDAQAKQLDQKAQDVYNGMHC